jgi:hypothetical protein
MRESMKLRPCLEPLEGKALLSAGVVGTPITAAATPPIIVHLDLNGTLRGEYSRHVSVKGASSGDVGWTYDFFGKGTVSNLGLTAVAGHIRTLGNVASGHAEGTLFLADARGTITLSLEGPLQKGGAGLPDFFTFKIVGGTGAFKHVADTGIASLVVIPAPSATATSPSDHGIFTLVLTSNPPPPTSTS